MQAAFLAGVGFKILKTGVTFMVSKAEMKEIVLFHFDENTFGLVTFHGMWSRLFEMSRGFAQLTSDPACPR